MRAHEAGALHAEGYRGPTWLEHPVDVNALVPSLWASSVGRGTDGALTVGGVSVVELAREFGTPAYVLDEEDFRARAREFQQTYAEVFGDLCGGADVYYAGKAFLCTEVARWIRDEGLFLDVCTGGELAVAMRAEVPGSRIGMHGNNKSAAEIRAALDYGVSRIIVDSFAEIERVAAIAAELGVVAPVLVRVTVGVEAHTHEFIATAHEDQKFGFSLAGGHAMDAVRQILDRPDTLRLLGLHSHIGSQIFDTAGFEVSARRVLGLHTQIARELGVELPELDLGGGFGIAYTTEHDPQPVKVLAAGMAEIVERECRADGVAVPRISIEPGRAIAGPSTFTLYEVGTVKPVDLDGGASRLYVSVDGGMSDNIRTALYDADYSCTVANRASEATPSLGRVVGRHCESGDIVVKDEFVPGDVSPGDLIAVPGTGAYCRALSSQYNHTPRPPVIAVRDGHARVIVRRETIDDLLALDV
ncbi:diaminopimelate decarboxylase [Intrasporangium calvum]|uniref:Diaminopimelate decarboxylase n=1 Tax=Intrasporangium calvum TaxID=53358 RepID=A0ABT5GLY9_9MICO|nr:diaminopimelate decarboxylase [Intrasporangium calvum]MDC5699216.1 diaminopimelate decarboxylase [Intrasporangium calvum]